ncbi:TMV resistance protein N-like isoform X2 [Malus domestica]|uniref:TMV resistance protein N-like isoform X2 n=1 Tax=Malus domestica TaxID=3750 RepID=UPI003974925D
MELIGFIQVFNIIVIAIGTLLYMRRRSLTFGSSTSSSNATDVDTVNVGVADVADADVVGATAVAAAEAADVASNVVVVDVVDDNDGDVDIPIIRDKYDVFISFRGEDTRKNFTSHLHAALLRYKIEAYIDYRLKIGDEIGRTLLEAIEKSRLSVIIFSKNYASSTWCLIELVHILKCRNKYKQMVVPIFYDINPSDVRKQEGSYKDAFAGLEKRFQDSMDKVIEWKAALVEATGLCGADYSNTKGTDADFIEKVVEDISTKLKREISDDLTGRIGIESRIKEVESLLSINDWKGVCTVGIWGMGGVGKTTLANAVFKRLFFNFESCCLLKNVREKSEQTDGIDQLKKTFLKEILKEENPFIDSTSVQQKLRRTKVLIVFDDVTDSKQIKDVVGPSPRYGDGSRIIVTSRERSVLRKAVGDNKHIYQLEKLKTDDALRLFQFHALNDNSPREEYTDLSARVVEYAGGIPLALEILGSLFFECESKDEWENALSTLRNNPNEKIQNTFRVSYDRLGRNAQEVFLDIACFHKGDHIEDVKKIVGFGQMHGGLCATDGIRVLRDRSLISIDSERETIDMHDLVQEMGWEIVREQCVEEPGRRSRLFIEEDVYHVLKNNTGTEKVQAIFFNGEQILDRADFKRMYNMRLLGVGSWGWGCGWGGKILNSKTLFLLPNSLRYLFWVAYPLKSLPPEFSLENLVELHMPDSEVTQLWDGGQNPGNLKVIQLCNCKHLTALPNLLGSPNIEHMDLFGCESLVEIPQYFKNLDKLTYLDLSRCCCLKHLPEMPDNIEFLKLQGSGIKELPSSVWSHEKISSLDITNCEELKELPSNTCKLKVSGAFSLYGCCSLEKVWELPRGIGELDFSRTKIEVLPMSSMERLFCLTKLKLKNCTNLVSLPRSICKLKSLEELDLTDCYELKVVPSCIYKLTNIKTLSFNYCWKLRNFPQPTGSVGFPSLEILNLKDSGILEIPEGVICSTSLRDLNLSRTKIRSIPSSIKQAAQLSCLCLIKCEKLRSLPELPMPSRLQANGCKSLKTVSSSRTAITQCWNRYELLREQLNFSNCGRLGYDARSNIMVDAQLRIMRVATASSKLEEEDYEKYSGPLVTIVCPGDEIPNWFVHQNEGASINVRLPANWFREGFLGFALSVVASQLFASDVKFECKYNFKTGEGESHEINCYFNLEINDEGICHYSYLQHVFVLYKDLEYEERTKWSSAFYDCVTEVSVHFWQEKGFKTVEKCGMCLLYAEDAEKLKCDVMSRQEQDEHAASGSGDPEASGSNESEEASGSDDSEGESGSDKEAKQNEESGEASGRDESGQASGSNEPDASRSD